MRIQFTLWLVLFFLPSPADNKAVVGTWEGESKCTVPDSPCRDEHVRYRIAVVKDDPSKLSAAADKIVQGVPQFMGTLICEYRQPVLSCTGNTAKQDDWQFRLSGADMTGTLVIGKEKTLYRRVALHKTGPA